jgi:hypothetical protein
MEYESITTDSFGRKFYRLESFGYGPDGHSIVTTLKCISLEDLIQHNIEHIEKYGNPWLIFTKALPRVQHMGAAEYAKIRKARQDYAKIIEYGEIL